jgi:hypothetical protein
MRQPGSTQVRALRLDVEFENLQPWQWWRIRHVRQTRGPLNAVASPAATGILGVAEPITVPTC